MKTNKQQPTKAGYTREQMEAPKKLSVYRCTDCQTLNALVNNGEITVGNCNKCEHPLWNTDEQIADYNKVNQLPQPQQVIPLDEALAFARWFAGKDTWDGDRYKTELEMYNIFKQETHGK